MGRKKLSFEEAKKIAHEKLDLFITHQMPATLPIHKERYSHGEVIDLGGLYKPLVDAYNAYQPKPEPRPAIVIINGDKYLLEDIERLQKVK